MALRPLTIGSTASDKRRFQTSAREKIKFILENTKSLLKVRNGHKYLLEIKEFNSIIGELEQWQLNKIEKIYEKVWQGAGYESYQPMVRKGEHKR